MNCEAFENRIQWILDQRLDLIEDPALEAHAQLCFECQNRLEQFIELERGLRELVVPVDPTFDIAAKVTAPFAQREVVERSTKDAAPVWNESTALPRRRWSALLAVAVLVAAIPTVLFLATPKNDPLPNSRMARIQPPPVSSVAPNGPLKASRPNGELNREDGSEFDQSEFDSDLLLQTINQIPTTLLVMEPYYVYAELPGVWPFASSLNLTVDWLRWSLESRQGNGASEEGHNFGIYDLDLLRVA